MTAKNGLSSAAAISTLRLRAPVCGSAVDGSGLWQAAHCFTQNGFNDRVQISSAAQVFHALRFRGDSAHGVENHL